MCSQVISCAVPVLIVDKFVLLWSMSGSGPCAFVYVLRIREQKSIPSVSGCSLYLVNRDALFSYHPASEAFLQRLQSLFVSSHYKNTPNDLQLLADAPAHLVFAFMKTVMDDEDTIPDVYCAIQVKTKDRFLSHRHSKDAGEYLGAFTSSVYGCKHACAYTYIYIYMYLHMSLQPYNKSNECAHRYLLRVLCLAEPSERPWVGGCGQRETCSLGRWPKRLQTKTSVS